MAGKRAPRYHNLVGKSSYYYFVHDENGNVVNNMTESEWKKMKYAEFVAMVKSGPYTYIVAIFHDKDTDPKSGELKGFHVHFIGHREDAITEDAFRKEWGITRVKDGEYLRNSAHMFRYLLHVTDDAMNELKHMYHKEELIVIKRDDVEFDLDKMFVAKKKDTNVTKKKDALHADVLTGEKTLDEVRAVYAADKELGLSAWSRDRKGYDGDFTEYLNAVNTFYQTHNSCKTTIFISGGGGAEKTTLSQQIIAPMFANKRGIHVPAAPMRRVTYDPIGTYRGEAVSVLNEINGASWVLEGFCECLDPVHSGLSGARYRDKAYFPDVVLMTTSDTRENFIRDMFLKWVNSAEGWSTAKDKLRLWYNGEWVVVNGDRVWKLDYDSPFLDTQERTAGRVPFSDSSDSIWDKLWQVRRRIPITIQLNDDKTATISILDYSKPTRLIGEKSSAMASYWQFPPVAYSTTDETIIRGFREALSNAIGYYYTTLNHFEINPATVVRPVIKI